MVAACKSRLLDFGFVTALLLTVGLPLLALRASPVLYRADSAALWAGALAGLVALWALLGRRWQPALAADVLQNDCRSEKWRTLAIAGLLGAVTLVAVYRPLRIHFWMGGDEFLNFQQHGLLEWMQQWDLGMNRPFTVLTCATGQFLTPGRIDGFLWLGAVLCWLNGLLLFAILRELLPQARLLPAVAAVLLIVDRSEPTRFFVMCISNNYWMALAFLLLAVWLFLRSARLGSRPLLALACASLGATLLMFEAAYPLAALVPVLAWFSRAHRRRLLLGTYAWWSLLGLFAVRFLLFLSERGGDAYQARQVKAVVQDPKLLLSNLEMHLTAGLINFKSSGAALLSWKSAAVVLTLVIALVGLAVWRTGDTTARKRYLLVLLGSALALLCGTLPFLPMGGIFRTQFFAGPGLAALVAGALCLAASLLGRRAGRVVVAGAVALLAANATGETIATQRLDRATSPVCFERSAHVFRQVHALCPNPAPDTLFVLVPTCRGVAPLGGNYPCVDMSPLILGTKMIQVGVSDGVLTPPTFGKDTVSVGPSGPFWAKATYDKVVAFGVAPDGTVKLLRRLPPWLLSPGAAADRYDPLPLLRSGPVKELFYFRYPRWAQWPCDLFAMADGIVFGAGWGPLECHGGVLSRQAASGAELAINSLGQDRRELHLRVDAAGADRLEALDLSGKVVATATIERGGEVRLTLPADPTRASVVKLRAVAGAKATGFRAFCPGGKATAPPLAASFSDMVVGELELGSNWHPAEVFRGEAFRWVTNDAEVILTTDLATRGELLVVVEPGPGLGGEPGKFTVRDQAGKIMATGCIRGREFVQVPLPAGTTAGTLFRLHVDNGGKPSPPDTRILNFRVLNCALRTE